MALYRAHMGDTAVGVVAASDGLDITASRTADRLFLHVVNTRMNRPADVHIDIKGATIRSAKALEIAVDPFVEIDESAPDVLNPKVRDLSIEGEWRIPSASVAALEIDIDVEL